MSKLRQSVEELQAAEDKKKELQILLDNKEGAIVELSKKNAELHSSLKNYEATATDVDKLEKIIAQKNTEIESASFRMEEVQRILSTNREERLAMTKENAGIKTQVVDLSSKLASATQKLLELEQANVDKNNIVRDLQHTCDTKSKDMQELEATIIESRKECAYLVAHVLEPIIETFAEKCREYTSTQDVVRSVYKELNDEQIIKLKEIDED